MQVRKTDGGYVAIDGPFGKAFTRQSQSGVAGALDAIFGDAAVALYSEQTTDGGRGVLDVGGDAIVEMANGRLVGISGGSSGGYDVLALFAVEVVA